MAILVLTLQAPTPKMVKHTQTICRQQPTYCLNVFDHFVGLTLKGLNWLVETLAAFLRKVDVFEFCLNILVHTLFLQFIICFSDNTVSNIAIYGNDTTLYSKHNPS